MTSEINTQIFDLFRTKNGVLSTADLLKSGFSSSHLLPLLKEGSIIRIHHGYYKWLDSELTENDDFIIIARIIPKGIICLVSALAYYQIITTIPREISIALARGATKPKRPTFPLVRYYYFASENFQEGVETINLNGELIPIYNLERSLCNCIKFRHKIGLEIVKEALKNYLSRPSKSIIQLEYYAKKLRISSILRQFLEILL